MTGFGHRPSLGAIAAVVVGLAAACGEPDSASLEPEPSPVASWSDAAVLAEGARYLDDAAFRRSAMIASLANPANTYSRQRIDNYGLVRSGWDALPEFNPQSLPVTTSDAAELRAGRAPKIDATTPRLWNGQRPTTKDDWVALGREVFFGYPLRSEPLMNYALERPEVGERVGVRAGPDGVYPGMRAFVDQRGETLIGITCALCHANVTSESVVAGSARRSFDYGALRLSWHEATKAPIDAELARRMAAWGNGRADITDDDDEDPVAIPDLWGLRHQTALTQAGTIKHTTPAALAIRQESQLLHASREEVRPPRELAFALAMYLYSLEPPPAAPPVDSDAITRGRDLFDRNCARCHSNGAFGGPPVPIERVGTDAALSNGDARGTGMLRPPSLLAVASAAPYFHDGSVPTLADLLSPERLEPSYAGSPIRKGPVPGHTFGTTLAPGERANLIAFLSSL